MQQRSEPKRTIYAGIENQQCVLPIQNGRDRHLVLTSLAFPSPSRCYPASSPSSTPNKREAAYLAAAHAFDHLNNETRVFWSVDCWLEKSEVVLTASLRDLIERKAALNTKSPRIPSRAHKRAKVGIAACEAEFKVDKLNQTSAPQAIPSSVQPEPLPAPAPTALPATDSAFAGKPAG
ncbi:hypothetical protein [Bradyrhizobium sp. JR3.5]